MEVSRRGGVSRQAKLSSGGQAGHSTVKGQEHTLVVLKTRKVQLTWRLAGHPHGSKRNGLLPGHAEGLRMANRGVM